MLTLPQQKIGLLAATTGAILATAAVSIVVPEIFPWSLLALAAAGVLLYWSLNWEITAWAWLWVLSFGMLDRPFWVLELPGFFNMTIPRLVFLAALVGFTLHFVLRGRGVHFDRPLLWMMFALLAYCALSATIAGWVAEGSPIPSAPYFRFLGAMLFPFTMFFLMYNAVGREKQIRFGLILLSVYGWYALYIGYLQYAAIMGWESARTLIFPAFINQPSWGPTYGIHFDRARGAFTMCNPQATFLVILFYVDLFLIRRLRGPYRAALVVQAILIPPAIFFTGLRSGYLAFLISGVVWALWAGQRRLGKVKLALAGVALLVAVAALWPRLTQTQRSSGGIAQTGPLIGRWVLAKRTMELFKQRPVFGVGFGHYLQAERQLEADPAVLTRLSTGLATPHNLLLVMLAETGLVGMLMTAAIFALLLRESLILYRRIPPAAGGLLCRGFVVLFWVAWVTYLTDAMSVDPLWDVAGNAMFWSFAGLVLGYHRLLGPQGEAVSVVETAAPQIAGR